MPSVLLAPAVLWVLAFTLFPLVYAVRVSVLNWHFGETPTWAGIGNYARMLHDDNLGNGLKVTLTFVVLSVSVELLVGLLLALLFWQPCKEPALSLSKGAALCRSLVTMPLFACPIAVGYIGMTLFHEEYGLAGAASYLLWHHPLPWRSGAGLSLVTLTLVDAWQWTPFTFLVLLAGLQAMPREPLEAAVVDGANKWALFRSIILPLLRPVVLTAFLFKVVYSFKVFDVPYILLSSVSGINEVLAQYIYVEGRQNFNFGYGAAMSLGFLFIVAALCTAFIVRMRSLYDG